MNESQGAVSSSELTTFIAFQKILLRMEKDHKVSLPFEEKAELWHSFQDDLVDAGIHFVEL